MPANDSWIYQGRDEKGRFGDGTSPGSGDATVGTARPGSGTDNMLPRMQAVIHGAVGHLSPAERQQYSAQLEQGGLSRLSEALLTWSDASVLDRDAFRQRFLGGIGNDKAVDHLRRAAEGASKATTPQQQRDAAGELASAWRSIGADRWPRFIAASHDQMGAATSSLVGRVVLAQAAMSNVASDAGAGVNPAGEIVRGRYVTNNPQQWVGQNSVGAGECVDLVPRAAGAPQTSEWRRGAQVHGNTGIQPGTVIATFDSRGQYNGHAAIYLGQDEHGVRVLDQWNVRDHAGRIIDRHKPSERTLPLGDPAHAPIDRGEFYYVVE